MLKFREKVSWVVRAVDYLAMAACFIMVFLVAIDVILRKISGQTVSISGSNELSQFLLIIVCTLSIPALQIKKGHVWVSMFVDKLPGRLRYTWLGIIYAVETVVSAMFTFASADYALYLAEHARVSDVLSLPYWPFAIVCAFGFLELTVLFACDTVLSFRGIEDDGSRPTEQAADIVAELDYEIEPREPGSFGRALRAAGAEAADVLEWLASFVSNSPNNKYNQNK